MELQPAPAARCIQPHPLVLAHAADGNWSTSRTPAVAGAIAYRPDADIYLSICLSFSSSISVEQERGRGGACLTDTT